MKRFWAAARIGFAAVAGLALGGCLGGVHSTQALSLAQLRSRPPSSLSTGELSRQLLLEMLSPGGRAEAVRVLRRRLDERGEPATVYWAHYARALDDEVHGNLADAPSHYLRAVLAASTHRDRDARLVAWLSAASALALRDHDPSLWEHFGEQVRALIEQPEGIGWRARAQLVKWWLDELEAVGDTPVDPREHQLGCVTQVKMAGPFSTGAAVHLIRSFPAEAPGPWPQRWRAEDITGVVPQVIPTVSRGCEVAARLEAPTGVYYAQTFLELPEEQEVIVAVRGGLAVWLDDHLVLERDPRRWGIWSKFGVGMRLAAGTHRLVARLSEAETLIRVLTPDGTPLRLASQSPTADSYQLARPQSTRDPNDLWALVGGDSPLDAQTDPLLRFLVAALAHLDGDSDVAAVTALPLIEPIEQAAGPMLSLAAQWVATDPVMTPDRARDQARRMHEQAVAVDSQLWRSQLSLALVGAGSSGFADSVPALKGLVGQFPQVPLLGRTLATVYGKLGWVAEQERLALQLLEDHPRNLEVLAAALPILDGSGQWRRAREVVGQLGKLDPSGTWAIEQAEARRQYSEALRLVERLGKRRPDQEQRLQRRRVDIRVAGGFPGAVVEQLQLRLSNEPKSAEAWLAEGDWHLAQRQPDALRQALGRATEAGADTDRLAAAIDLVESQTDFAPFRKDGAEVVRQFEATGKRQEGTAARVLDYAAVWVHGDGSSRMLEHEIVRLQTAEAIDQFAEHRPLPGVVLQMRVIKPDGKTLEPLRVSGKPTVTFPHLEVGDYLETESLQSFPAEENGRHYQGMRWYFREENIAYAHSEFVLIAPRHRHVDVEITGSVPTAEQVEDEYFITRRWKVLESPAASVEPLSPPVSELLPSVRIGWGHDLPRRLRRMGEQTASMVPVDPRLRKVAEQIVRAESTVPWEERAKALYRWVQDNVTEGQSKDGRQAVLARQGSRWQALTELLRAQDIPVDTAVIRNRLAARGLGPLSDSETYTIPLLRVGPDPDAIWLSLQDQYAPFGYVPAEAVGMGGFILGAEQSRPIVVDSAASTDTLEYTAHFALDSEGNAEVQLTQTLAGKYGARMRGGLAQVADVQMREVVESRLLGRALPGARLEDYHFEDREQLDKPLVLVMRASIAGFAQVRAGRLVIEPPMMPRLGQLVSLAERQTPLLIRESMHQRAQLTVDLPTGARAVALQRGQLASKGHHVAARDRAEPGRLVLDREVFLDSGRVGVDEYPAFRQFAGRAEAMLISPIVIELQP